MYPLSIKEETSTSQVGHFLAKAWTNLLGEAEKLVHSLLKD